MKSRFENFIALILILGFCGIQFASLIDDPSHLAEPDPDCLICIASNTPAYLHIDTPVNFNLDIIYYIVENSPLEPITFNYKSNLSIRAPPATFFI